MNLRKNISKNKITMKNEYKKAVNFRLLLYCNKPDVRNNLLSCIR